jgi:hypothetical protein
MNRLLACFAAGSVAALSVVAAPSFATAVFAAAQANERVVYVSAFDEKTSAPVTGLGPRDIVVREDGIAREVLRVTPANSPMPVAILVDNTQAASNNIADIRRALTAFVKSLQGLGPVAIIGVAERPTILRDYTTDQTQLLDAIGRVFAMPGAGATLLDAIVETSRGLRKREEDRAAIVILTTENIEFSTLYYKQVLDELERGGAQLHAVILNTPRGTSLDDPARNRASVLDEGPKNSGGTRSDVLTSQAFEGELLKLAAILKAQHRVVYSRPQTLIPPEKLQVSSAKPGVIASGGAARGQSVR